MAAKQVLAEIKKTLRPSDEEYRQMKSAASTFIATLNRNLKGAKAVLGGSAQKGTWVHQSHDIDVFVQFSYKEHKEKSEALADLLEPMLAKACGKGVVRLHGSRDYFQLRQGKYDFEIIPILNVTKPMMAKNITDLSPLHAKWVARKEKGHVDDIRLMKAFCKAQGIYGAESHIKGFSGYGCEVLVLHYGSFEKVLRASQKWKEGQVVDPEGYYKGRNALLAINKSKISPLILIDPIDEERNVLAALGKKQWKHFIKTAAAFLKEPKASFFVKETASAQAAKKRLGKKPGVLIEAVPLDGKEDVAGAKMLKALSQVRQSLGQKGFVIQDMDWLWSREKAYAWIITTAKILPESVEVQGPPAANTQHAAHFRKKHSKVTEKKGVLYAKEKNKERDLEKITAALLKDKYVVSRVKTARVMQA